MKGYLFSGVVLAALISSHATAATTVRFAHHYEPTHPGHTCLAQPMAESINAANVGLDVKVFTNGQLGTPQELVEQLAIGEAQLTVAAASDLGAFYKPISVMDVAYFFDDYDAIMQFAGSDVGKQMYADVVKTANIRIVGTWLYGTRHLTANRPVRNTAEMAGLKIRTPGAAIMMSNIQAMGGSATPMAFGEVYLGLQQGTIDAQENPLPTIQNMKFYEQQKYLMLTSHLVMPSFTLVSEFFWKTLNDEQKAAVEKAAVETAAAITGCIQSEEKAILDQWRSDKTIEIIEVDIDAFRAKTIEHYSSKPDASWGDVYKKHMGVAN
ncbi:MAG: DctP family TRAP transporter solute-binding subunit [Candidimonas sp.]|nr:DctP family TRAP transporter solute-binding subunit [Candidimonas sp.]